MNDIVNTKVLILATDGFEKSELMRPRDELKKAGATVHVASPRPGEIKSWDNGDWGETVPVDMALEAVDVDKYQALVLPGGVINPDKLRLDRTAIRIIREFVESGKTVAAICHGPWLLAEAGVLDGKSITSYASIRTDVENAGGVWQDREVVVDNGLITSRSPDDLPAFITKIVEEIGEGAHAR